MKHNQMWIIFILYLSQSDDSDVWDDTALIKAYDKAVASFKVWNVYLFFSLLPHVYSFGKKLITYTKVLQYILFSSNFED